MNFVLFAERSGPLDTGRIRDALDAIQRENALLRARITWTDAAGLCFAPAPGLPIDLECCSVDADAWQAGIERELSRPFADGVAPLVRCLYLHIQVPDHCVLALCFHHSVADGRSGDALMRGLLGYIATGAPRQSGTDVAALPALYEVFPPRFRWADQADSAKQLTRIMMGDYLRHGAVPPLAGLSRDATGRTPRFIRLRLAPDVTQRLLVRSRENATSVHGALCAAQLLAQFRLQPTGGARTLLLSCSVDMRPHLEPVQAATPSRLYVTMISAAFSVDGRTDLWDLARQVIRQTRLQLARGEDHLFFNLYGLDALPITPDRMERFRKNILSTWQNTMVSNIGRVATVDADPAVEAISFVLCPMPYQSVFNAVSTYKDQILLYLGYDAARLSETNAQAPAQGMRDLLMAAAAPS